MTAAVREYLAATAALAAASLTVASSVAPVAPRQPGAETADLRLSASDDELGVTDPLNTDLLNVSVNLFTDIANIPYNLFEAPYDIADPALIPNFSDNADGLRDTSDPLPNDYNPTGYDGPQSALMPTYDGPDDGIFHGAINNLASALDYTGSWAGPSSTNVWGWETGNPWNGTALVELMLPVKPFSEPAAQELNTVMQAESPIAGPENNFLFHDPLGILQDQLAVPVSQLLDGYSFTGDDEAINPVGPGADFVGDGGIHYPEIWNGTTVYLDPSLGLDEFLDHLTDDPADNPIHPLDSSTVVPTLAHALEAINADFNPLQPGTDSFLFQGASVLWGVPTAINGVVTGEHGIAPDPDHPDAIVADDVTAAVGGVADDLIGPDSGLAQALVTVNYGLEEVLDSVFGQYLPDGAEFAPADVPLDGAEASDIAAEAAAALLG